MKPEATKQFEAVCDILDTVQGVIYEMLEDEPSLAQEDPITLINAAISIMQQVQNMSPEDQQLIKDLNEKVLANELTIEEAIKMAPRVESEPEQAEEEELLVSTRKVDKKKKPLLN